MAPRRVEAALSEIRIGAPVVGRIALAKPNDKVFASEVLICLDASMTINRWRGSTFPRRRPPRASAPATISRRREGQANGATRRINLPMRNGRLPMRAPHSTRWRPTGASLAVRRRILTRRAAFEGARTTRANSAPPVTRRNPAHRFGVAMKVRGYADVSIRGQQPTPIADRSHQWT